MVPCDEQDKKQQWTFKEYTQLYSSRIVPGKIVTRRPFNTDIQAKQANFTKE